LQRASTVKAACPALPGEILNAEINIDLCDELKALVTDPAYWKGVAAMETLFMTISSCLTYLEGDEAVFLAVYACFVAIKYHIKTINRAVMDAFNLGDDDIEQMMTMIHPSFSTIYSEFALQSRPSSAQSSCKWGGVRSTTSRRPHSPVSRTATRTSIDRC
jgi:hypothetical protein